MKAIAFNTRFYLHSGFHTDKVYHVSSGQIDVSINLEYGLAETLRSLLGPAVSAVHYAI